MSHQRARIPAQNENEGDIDLIGFIFNRSVPKAFDAIVRTNISPRIGVTYDLLGDGKTLVKASYSRYVQPNVQEYFWTANPNSAYYYIQLLNPDGTVVPDAYLDAGYPVRAKTSYEGYKAKSPYSDEVIFSVEKEIFRNFSLGIRFIRKWERNLLEDVDASQLDLDALLKSGEYVWKNWEQVTVADPYNGQMLTFWNKKEILARDLYLLSLPDAKRDYKGLEFTVQKKLFP